MISRLLAGSIITLAIGQTFAQVPYGGVNIAGGDFGCDAQVRWYPVSLGWKPMLTVERRAHAPKEVTTSL